METNEKQAREALFGLEKQVLGLKDEVKAGEQKLKSTEQNLEKKISSAAGGSDKLNSELKEAQNEKDQMS